MNYDLQKQTEILQDILCRRIRAKQDLKLLPRNVEWFIDKVPSKDRKTFGLRVRIQQKLRKTYKELLVMSFRANRIPHLRPRNVVDGFVGRLLQLQNWEGEN